ncbi:NADH dehydrogenase [Parasphingorhabdus marina DSM 22363]|uniref:NADH dehydrogenase n=1 Tax=Parasphingorhabdus marina DSM 22363 TaxID=1123272 RepID=A0A1N6CN31_9SPHN|nr:complex I NDUFA9 subunit family protein [Parasphingorhabdus marina]SIN59906.1 NADH dehydrogenase [Parasphingorhabdus marina DSM 22363]
MALDGQLICIFGGGGFLGRYIAQKLLSGGARVRIAERGVRDALHIKPLGGLGQTQFASADITKKDSVARAVHGCDAVINLVGILKGDFERVHVEGARHVAEAAAAEGCGAMVQMSAIGADVDSPSAYGRSKGEGEQAVREAFPGAIILRPSIVFGREDQFINRFAQMITMLPIVPVIGSATKFQPVFVGDVADAVAAALADADSFAGQTFELGGPEQISMGDLNRRIAEMTNRDRGFIELPDFVARAMATMTGFLPLAPITKDQYLMLQVDNVVAKKAKGLDSFGVAPTPMAAVARGWMEQYTVAGRFGARAKAG